MPNYNKVTLIGHLTRDPETRTFSNGGMVTHFSIAVNRYYKKDDERKEETSFIDLEAFSKVGEIIAKYLKKGDAALFEGRLKQDSWEDKESGTSRSKIKVVVEQMQMLGGGKSSDDEESNPSPKVAKEK